MFCRSTINLIMTDKSLEIRGILSKNLKEQRKKLGYSQEKFAEISGLSVQTVNDIEGGRKWVSDKTISKLSAALQIECYQLLMPEFKTQNRKETNSTQQLLELMKNLKKDIDSQIIDHFISFLKSKSNARFAETQKFQLQENGKKAPPHKPIKDRAKRGR